MQPIDKTDLERFAPHALPGYFDRIDTGSEEMARAGIATPLRLAHFLAQTAHETGGFRIVRENTGWTAEQMCRLWPSRFKTRLDPRILACRGDAQKLANLAYSGRADIGNLGGDDGWAYRGGGLLQLTGRAAYCECGQAIAVDLEGMPELIEDPAVSLMAALWVWGRHPNNSFADHNYGRTIGNAINRGNPFSKYPPIGAPDREQWFRRAGALFGQGQPLPDDAVLHLGAYGQKVARVQGQLRDLGYGIGDQDGVYGPTMARAVAGFKLDHQRNLGVELEPGETIGTLRHWIPPIPSSSHPSAPPSPPLGLPPLALRKLQAAGRGWRGGAGASLHGRTCRGQ